MHDAVQFSIKQRTVLLSPEDADLISVSPRWQVNTPRGGSNSYVIRNARRADGSYKTESLHRVVAARMGLDVTGKVDHRDGNGLNCCRWNLRAATDSQNMQNKRMVKPNRAGFKGVWYHPPREMWRAAITVNGKRRYLGYFRTPETAHEAYVAAAQRYFGEFARAS